MEMVLTVTAISLLAAYTIVPVKQKADLNGASNKIASDLRYARGLAITEGTTHGVTFTTSSPYYFIYKSTTATPIKDPLTQQTMSEKLNKYRGVSVTNVVVFEFDKNGKPTTGGGSTVNLSDGTNTSQVRVVSNTGFVETL